METFQHRERADLKRQAEATTESMDFWVSFVQQGSPLSTHVSNNDRDTKDKSEN